MVCPACGAIGACTFCNFSSSGTFLWSGVVGFGSIIVYETKSRFNKLKEKLRNLWSRP